MDLFVKLVIYTALALVWMLDLCMLIRAVLSWIPSSGGSLSSFLRAITDPLIIPFRKLCDRFGWFRNSPLDVPFLFAVVALMLLASFLESLL